MPVPKSIPSISSAPILREKVIKVKDKKIFKYETKTGRIKEENTGIKKSQREDSRRWTWHPIIIKYF